MPFHWFLIKTYVYMRKISHLSETLFIPVSLHAYFWVVMLLSLFTSLLSEISSTLRWDPTWVGWINSHINDLFLQSEIYHSANISLRWWFFSYKQLLNEKKLLLLHFVIDSIYTVCENPYKYILLKTVTQLCF